MKNAAAERPDFLEFDDNNLVAQLCGPGDAHLVLIEDAIGAALAPRGNRIAVTGAADARALAKSVLEDLYGKLKLGAEITSPDVEASMRIAQAGGRAAPLAAEGELDIRTPRRVISPRSPAQADYLSDLKQHELVFGIGPAGTGKTYLAVAHAIGLLLKGEVERVILSRPALEAGEHIGFLPGDMKEKVDPYLRPLYDALYDMLPVDYVDRRIAARDIEIAPLAFMRGRTLTRAAAILDEAQNATAAQMKMFLTRLGEGSHMAVTGDPTQSDLRPGEISGLGDAVSVLAGVDGVAVSRFTAADVVRHALVARIVNAYEARDAAGRAPAAPGDARAPNKPSSSPMTETIVAGGDWPRTLPGSAALAEESYAAARAELGAGVFSAPVSVKLTDDAELQALNKRFRNQDKPTNVLSFPAGGDLGEPYLGDVALGYETCAREAADKGIALRAHAAHLIVHGLLHLAGYDHVNDEEAAEMEMLETRVLARMGVADPYMEETDPDGAFAPGSSVGD